MMKGGDRIGFGMVMYVRIFYVSGEGNLEVRYGFVNEVLGLLKEDIDEVMKFVLELVEKGGILNQSYSFVKK